MLYAIVGAILVGACLGLLGSGGAILTVPLLVYLVGHAEKQAITESLAIVGIIASAGALRAWSAGRISWAHVLLFGVPGMGGAWCGARLAVYLSGAVQLTLLALVMFGVAALMVAGTDHARAAPRPRRIASAAQGFGVGVVTGLLGVGGGFLIVPTLVVLGGLPMSLAVGTSLGVIALNCAAGYFKSLHELGATGGSIDPRTTMLFAAVGVVGTLLGAMVGARLNQHILRRIFAVFLVLMAAYILIREVPRLRTPHHPEQTATSHE